MKNLITFFLGLHAFVVNSRKWRRFTAALLPRLFGNSIPGHTTRAPPVGFELATSGIQFYVIANLDKTSTHANRHTDGQTESLLKKHTFDSR